MNAIATQATVKINQALTMAKIKQVLKCANTDKLEKPIVFGMTVRQQDIQDSSQMKRVIAQHLFDNLTERAQDDGSVIVGDNRINYVYVKDYQIMSQSPTLFQRIEVAIEATVVIEKEKI